MYHLDFESYSACDIGLGAYRYACDPTTRILLCAIAYGDNLPVCWDSRDPDGEESRAALRLIHECSTSSEPVFAHNAQFECAVSTYLWETTFGCPPPALDRWRCTAAMCRRAAIPWSLAGAAEFLRLSYKKDKAGGRLIQIFSIPQKKAETGLVTVEGTKMTREAAWDMFKAYCRRDVEVERELHQRMKAYDLTGDALRSFQFDLKMNHLGVPVDVPTLQKAQLIVEEYNDKLSTEFNQITGLAPSQTMAFTAWVKERGYPGDDLTAASMEAWANHSAMSPEAQRALAIRAALSFAATKKISTMLECACPDGRVRGAFMWYGAVRTGRWSGRLIQPQNFRRPTITDTDTCYDVIALGGGLEALETLYDSPLEALSSVVRNFIRADNQKFIDLDLANIEGRVAGWLAGDEDLLNQFRAGVDVYKVMAGAIYSVPPEEVTKSQRLTGKIAVLSCGYGTGWARFQTMAEAQGQPLDDKTAKLTVFKYRKARSAIVATWRAFGDAAASALRDPGAVYKAGELVTFRYGKTCGFPALLMTLPSGRRLVYPDPRIETRGITAEVLTENEAGEIVSETMTFTTDSITFYGQGLNNNWTRVETHTSRLFENACQATAGDFLNHGLLLAEDAGFEVCSVIHDQALAKHEPEKGLTLDKFLELMTRVPEWATGFPLKAEAHTTHCYSK